MITEITKDNINELDNSFLSKEDIIKELDQNPFAKIIVLKEQEKIIGYLYYSEIYERIEINQFEVEETMRNCGKGQQLLSYLINTVDKDISLEVKEDNYSAIHLYEKNGFIKSAIRPNYYNGTDGILMIRNKEKTL